MADPIPSRPLWQVMRQADSSVASDYQSPEARMILAMRDWLVPEDGYHDFTHGSISEIQWRERQHLRKLLLAEADRAEAGG